VGDNSPAIITVGQSTNATQLQASLPLTAAATKRHISAIAHLTSPPPCRTNVKWSRVLLHKVPTGATDSRAAYSPDECHKALVAENPFYSSLTITQRPSWVRHPSSYTAGSASSLSFAFEDPDGTLTTTLSQKKVLYAFGHVITIKKWKQRTTPKTAAAQPPSTAPNPP
jgi:hypothetical protein